MPTSVIFVPAGTNSAVYMATPQTNVFAAPQVLGGTVALFSGPSPVGPFTVWGAGAASISGDSFRPGAANQYYFVSAATQQAVIVATDMGGSNQPTVDQIVSVNTTLASGSSTAIQKLYSLKLPPLFLPTNFKMVITGTVRVVNSATVKTLTCLMNGITGTSFFTSPSLASNALYTFQATFWGDGTGQTLTGGGSGATGGYGLSATDVTTLARDYINNETEIVIAATKATGTDLMDIRSLLIQLE
jgi:hypothetical protein